MRWLGTLTLLVTGLVLAVIVAGLAEALRDPVVTRYQIGFANWPKGAPPLRVAQLSDTHVSWPDMPAARLDRIVDQVNALDPDIVVLTGDYLGGKLRDRYAGDLDDATRPFTRLRARLGVFAVRGNHDGPHWTPFVFRRWGIPLLKNRWVAVGPVILAGVDDLTGEPQPWQAVKGAPADRPLILLAHEPDFFTWMPARVDLFVAGHTHGGQLNFPIFGAPSTGSPFLDSHLRGVFFEGRKRMVVSSGIGTSVVPLRIGVPPEIALMTWGPATP